MQAGTVPLDPQDFPAPEVPALGAFGLAALAGMLLAATRRRLRSGFRAG